MASVGGTLASGGAMALPLTSGLTPGGHGGAMGEEPSDLEELEQFARTFKQRRIKLGFTQVGGGEGLHPGGGGASVCMGGGGWSRSQCGWRGRSFTQAGEELQSVWVEGEEPESVLV